MEIVKFLLNLKIEKVDETDDQVIYVIYYGDQIVGSLMVLKQYDKYFEKYLKLIGL
ncbi:MAG: hypothetical protein QW607_06130 [Desulfurococcaceae archaeon]